MSNFLSKAIGGIGHAVTGVGHAVGSALSNPIVKTLGAGALAATGVGAPLAAGIMGAGGALGGALKPGGGLKPAIGGGATGALSGYAAGKLGDVLHGGGGFLDKAKGLYGTAAGMMGHGGGSGMLGSALGLGGGGGSSGGGNGISPAVMALAGLQAANAASLGKTANDYSDKAFNFANDSYASRAGLRSAGINALEHPKAPDMGSLSAIRAQNPVAAHAGVGAPPMAPTPALPSPVPANAPALPSAPAGGFGVLRRALQSPMAPPAGRSIGHMLPLRQPMLA